MLVSEKFKDKGLFEAMQEIEALKFCDLIPAEQMDILYLSLHGNRKLSYLGESKTVDEIAVIMVKMFYPKWNKLYDVETTNISLDSNFTERVTETIEDVGTNTLQSNTTINNQVSPYDSEDFVNDNKEDNRMTNEGSNNNVKTKEYNKEYLQGNITTNLQKVTDYLQNNYFNDIIVVDINKFLTLSIY